jgi:hypothetical protein
MTLEPMMVTAAVLAGLVLALGAALAATAASLRQVRRAVAASEARLGELAREVEGATAIGVRAGERLRKLEQTGAQLGARLGQLELRGEGRPYDQAIDLVRHGADADRLVRNFGLSRGEADLVALVHGRRKAG